MFWKIVIRNSKKQLVTCRYCRIKYTVASATLISRHLIKCKNRPEDLQGELSASDFADLHRDKRLAQVNVSVNNRDDSSRSQTPNTIPNSQGTSDVAEPRDGSDTTSISSVGKRKIDRWIDVMNNDTRAELDEALAWAWYVAGIPFSTIDNTYMRKAFKKLRPAYVAKIRKMTIASRYGMA